MLSFFPPKNYMKIKNAAFFIFSHPDFTVGSGITPDRPSIIGSWTVPPVWNLTMPRRHNIKSGNRLRDSLKT